MPATIDHPDIRTAPLPAPGDSRDPRLDAIRERVLAGERLTIEEGEAPYGTPDLWDDCAPADAAGRCEYSWNEDAGKASLRWACPTDVDA